MNLSLLFCREEEDNEDLERVLKIKDDDKARLIKNVISEVK